MTPDISHGRSTPRVLVIVLCYNGIDLTRACLRSLREVRYPNMHVLVVDNLSQDSTPAIVRAEFPEVQVLETGANLGYAEGNNAGLREALAQGCNYALLLNNDTEAAPDFLSALVEACEADKRIGVAGPKVNFFEPQTLVYSAGGRIDWTRGNSEMIGLNAPDRGQFDAPREVDFVSGCALLVRCDAIRDAGLLDARFGMYYEETEWCVRIHRHGWKVMVTPASVIWHKIDPLRQAESPRIAYYMTRNRLLFLSLTRAPVLAWLNAALAQDGRTWLSYTLRPKWRNKRNQKMAMQRGWADFLRGRFGMVNV
jgi:GT2 family glycosyltransferase